MKSADLLNTVEEKGIHIFTVNDAVRLSDKKRAYVWLMLSRLVSNGTLLRAERGIYYTPRADRMEVASNIVQPSYVSLMYALNYYGVTTQIPTIVDVVSSKRHRPITLNDVRIRFRTLKSRKMFGFHREGNANIADLEKAFVDALYFKSPESGEISEALESAIRSKRVDIKRMEDYAKAMGSMALLKRMRALLSDI